MEKNYRGNESNQASQWTPNTPENGNNDSGEKKNRKKLIIVVIIAVVAIIAIIVAISFRKTTVPAVDVSQTEESVSVAVPEATEPASTATVEETTTTVEAETNSETESESESTVEMLDFETYAAQEGADSINLVVYNKTSGTQEIILPCISNADNAYYVQPNDQFAVNTSATDGSYVRAVKINGKDFFLSNDGEKSFVINVDDTLSEQKIIVSIVLPDESFKFQAYMLKN